MSAVSPLKTQVYFTSVHLVSKAVPQRLKEANGFGMKFLKCSMRWDEKKASFCQFEERRVKADLQARGADTAPILIHWGSGWSVNPIQLWK